MGGATAAFSIGPNLGPVVGPIIYSLPGYHGLIVQRRLRYTILWAAMGRLVEVTSNLSVSGY